MEAEQKERPKMKDYPGESYSESKHLIDLIRWSWWAEEEIKRLKFLSEAPKQEQEETCPMCDNPKEKDGHNCCEECGGITL